MDSVKWLQRIVVLGPADHVLMSRLIDDAGKGQPVVRNPSRKDVCELNFCAPVRCSVR